MRRSRLDELPQLLNILVGDMSLIGPRPLLPRDQPKNIDIRLMVRPGITGWAQVNGGILLTPEEKERLDEFYVRNASLWLDLRIVVMTALMFFRGDRRTRHLEEAVASVSIRINDPVPRRVGSHHPPCAGKGRLSRGRQYCAASGPVFPASQSALRRATEFSESNDCF
jgi:hypothetical protein